MPPSIEQSRSMDETAKVSEERNDVPSPLKNSQKPQRPPRHRRIKSLDFHSDKVSINSGNSDKASDFKKKPPRHRRNKSFDSFSDKGSVGSGSDQASEASSKNMFLRRHRRHKSFDSQSDQGSIESGAPRGRSDQSTGSEPKRRTRSLSLSKRLGSFRRATSSSPTRTRHHDDESDLESEIGPPRDPVIDMLESRTTQRVRFNLDEKSPERIKTKTTKVCEPPPALVNSELTKTPSGFNIKSFMRRNLFSRGDSTGGNPQTPSRGEMVWESGDSQEYVQTSNNSISSFSLAFVENPTRRAEIVKHLNKGRRAQQAYFQYEYAIKCYMKALRLLNKANYPDEHPLMLRTLGALNNAHHAVSAFENSANIVKMGIKYEESGDLVKALKMYTVAYRIRRDNLSRAHPSLVVLLNILASIQAKRGELKESLQIYELALKEIPVFGRTTTEEEIERAPSGGNYLARAVTFREMGFIHERMGDDSKAVTMYHRSLDCASQWRDLHRSKGPASNKTRTRDEADQVFNMAAGPLCSLQDVQFVCSSSPQVSFDDGEAETCEVELFISPPATGVGGSRVTCISSFYDSFFPQSAVDENKEKAMNEPTTKSGPEEEVKRANFDISLTLHQIAQMYRRQEQYTLALDAYLAASRGMKLSLGSHHPNVAAILGNIGNLQKEMGDLDAAYDTYQEVLGIESRRLGVSHPEVAISLHNVATIEAARHNFVQALSIYRKVLTLQKKLFGEEHISVAVTLSCMGDVHSRLGENGKARECYEDSLKIKTGVLGRHNIEVARTLHRMGKMNYAEGEYHLADSYISRAVLLYRINKIDDDHEWIVDAYRDSANIDAAIATGGGMFFEC